MEKEKKALIAKIAAVIALVVLISAAAVAAVVSANRARSKVINPSRTVPADTEPAITASAPETSPPETTAATTPTPETTSAPATTLEETTTIATTLPPETTPATTSATTAATTVTTTASTAATTTVAATTAEPEPDFGVLGYDLSSKASTDTSGATGSLSGLVINEVCAKNKSSLKDKDGENSDWIEIYNPSDKAVNLEGAALSDDAAEPLKWIFPSVNIQPKGYLVVFCSDKDLKTPELHTGFKISSGSEQLILSGPDGKLIDSVIVAESGDDVTYGRYPQGGDTYKLLSATPGETNDRSDSQSEAALAAPIFSQKSGFYGSAFTLTITAPAGSTVYYTTDGSAPTTSSQKYSSGIQIKDRSSESSVLSKMKGTTVDNNDAIPNREFEKATIIRAVTVDSKGRMSRVTTATYFVGKEIANKYKNVAVISITVDPDDLYDPATGIYVAGNVFKEWRKANPSEPLDGNSQANFNQRGRDWERDAHIDFFRGGELEFGENVGIRTHGGWSRNNPQKSFKFYFRSDYGESKLKYELFENNRSLDSGKQIKEYKRFMVRDGGNDSFTLLFKDAWTQDCIKDMAFSTQASDIAIGFLDGEYWGIYTLNEVIDDNFVESHYGINSDDVVMIKVDALEEGVDGDKKLWDDAVSFVINNDMSKPANYQKACEYIDIESLAEYLAMEIYIGNEDWLYNNWAAWRIREPSGDGYKDGKWRFMVYDTEFSMDLYGNGSNYRYDVFTPLSNGEGHLGGIFRSLLKNSDFRKTFVVAMEDVMNVAFNPVSAGANLDTFYKRYSPYMNQHFERFIFWQNKDKVKDNVEGFKKWLKNRPDYMFGMMKDILGLETSRTNTITINIESVGTVKVNGLPIKTSNGTWEGKYLAGYKISLEAVPANGYEFAGWSGGFTGDAAKITVDPASSYSFTANFKKKG